MRLASAFQKGVPHHRTYYSNNRIGTHSVFAAFDTGKLAGEYQSDDRLLDLPAEHGEQLFYVCPFRCAACSFSKGGHYYLGYPFFQYSKIWNTDIYIGHREGLLCFYHFDACGDGAEQSGHSISGQTDVPAIQTTRRAV